MRLVLKTFANGLSDLYQLHWPERKTNTFGQRAFTLQDDEWRSNIHAKYHNTLDGFIKEGKIKHIGLSNENAGNYAFS
jgi:diketogulonate reductase-like aldo/keto reductase